MAEYNKDSVIIFVSNVDPKSTVSPMIIYFIIEQIR